ncbi:MAG: 50S ribosome-binding GTPase, partial [Oscillospiraceae bacterium]|nr:50S ribosome-binding GTPase [Oscillospiraceae bacterium]
MRLAKIPIDTEGFVKKPRETDKVIALCGNPNVGKSTVFNALTGLRQHTGNWPGKTVTSAQGYYTYKNQGFVLVDLPGCYSLDAHSAEEEVACGFIRSEQADAVVIVCDAACLERNLILVLQTMNITSNVIVCVNLLDEARKKQIVPNLDILSQRLGVPVIGTTARDKKGLGELMLAVTQVLENPRDKKEEVNDIDILVRTAEEICAGAVIRENKDYINNDRRIDRLLTGKLTAFPVMLLALLGIFWLTITGSNYPSQLISTFLFWVEGKLLDLFSFAPVIVKEVLILGVYRVLAWVVSVMLPPMAIFFPLFTLLEDAGVL